MRARPGLRLTLLAGLAPLAALACLDSDDDPVTGSSHAGGRIVCEQLVDKLRSCNLVTEGELPCDNFDEPEQRCQADCAQRLSCDDLESLFCALVDTDIDTLSSIPGGQCFVDCAESNQFDCGNGVEIPGSWVCDFEDDCGNGEDEADCDFGAPDTRDICFDEPSATGCFQCADGQGLPPDWECDDFPDCNDGSDEVSCPPRAEILCMGQPI